MGDRPPQPGALSRRRFLTGAAAGAGTLVVGPTLWARPARAAVPAQGAHLTFGADPARQMQVSWSTPANVRDATLDLGTDRSYGLVVGAESRTAPGVASIYHHVRLDDLQPGTTYHYRLRHAGSPGVTGAFTTAPARPRPFRFATFGDMGVGAAAAENLGRILAARPAFAFVVGDLCYADAAGGTGVLDALPYDPTVWDAWFEQVRPSAASVPWMPTVGNHEMERDSGDLGYDGFLARFALPTGGAPGGPVTYAFRYGNVGFVALDGNDASYEISRNNGYLGHAQDEWLDATLRRLRDHPDVDFLVVGFHNCMYCSNAVHGSDGGTRARWQHLFERHGVDLVVNGHNHCYERTHPLRGGAPVVELASGGSVDARGATTYLTAGGAGQAEYPTMTHPVSYVVADPAGGIYGGVRVPELALWSAARHAEHSVAVVDVTPCDRQGLATMRITGVARTGEVLDQVTLVRSGRRP